MPCTIGKGVVLLFTGNNTMNKRLCRVPKSPARIIKIPASRLKGSVIVCFSSSLFHATFADLSRDTFVGSVELLTHYKVGLNGLRLPFGKLEYRQERDAERWEGEGRGEREKVSSGMLEARRKAYFHFMAVLSHGAGGELARMRMG